MCEMCALFLPQQELMLIPSFYLGISKNSVCFYILPEHMWAIIWVDYGSSMKATCARQTTYEYYFFSGSSKPVDYANLISLLMNDYETFIQNLCWNLVWGSFKYYVALGTHQIANSKYYLKSRMATFVVLVRAQKLSYA